MLTNSLQFSLFFEKNTCTRTGSTTFISIFSLGVIIVFVNEDREKERAVNGKDGERERK